MERWNRRNRSLHKDKNITFQTLTWRGYDVDDLGAQPKFVITTCGSTQDGKSIGLTITGFNPFLFVKIPDRIRVWTETYQNEFEKYMSKKVPNNTLVSIEKIKSKILYPFTNEKKYKFLKITVRSLSSFRRFGYLFKKPIYGTTYFNGTWEPYEANIDPVIRFSHLVDITTSGWIDVSECNKTSNYTNCEINLSVSSPSYIKQNTTINKNAPFVMASYDIEVDSQATRHVNKDTYNLKMPMESRKKLPTVFPNAKKNDTIRIICTSYQRFGTQDYFRHCIALSPCAEVPNADYIEIADSETQLLIKWLDLIKRTDPDIIMGYNIYGFDDEYIHDRLVILGLTDYLYDFTRVKNVPCELKDAKLVTSAYGTNFFKIIDVPCLYKIDLYVWMKREEKLESYKLDNVAEHFLKDKKVDLPPIDLFFKMHGTGEQMAECCGYCVQDTMLPLRLVEKNKILIRLISMANITRVPIEWLITRGQQIKVFSQISYESLKSEILIPTWEIPEDAPEEKYLGATVLHAKKGAYFEGVSGLDFKSLYPSIMIAFNLCYSTMILDRDLDEFHNNPDLEIETISWEQDGETQTYNYVQNIKGVVPNILDKLWKQRNSIKKLMKKAKADGDYDLASIYDAEQLAVKVSMNSVYGFTGASKGYLPKKPIASSVTSKGRELIQITKDFCEKTYNCDVVYGDTDSCYVKFDVGLTPKDPGYMQKIFEISELATIECNNKLYKAPVELEFEKVMMPFFLFTKKRYAYVQYTNPDKHDYLDAKGIHFVRRDNCQYVRTISKIVLDTLFFDLDVDKAKDNALTAIGDLLENKCKVCDLKLSKTLKVGYKCSKCHVVETECTCPEGPRVNLPHVQLAKSLKQAAAADIPQPGERVPFVFVEGVGLQHERVAHPDYMNGRRPDGLYYLEHQLRVPLETLFELVLPNGDTSVLFENGPYGSLIESLKSSQKVRETDYKANKRLIKAQGFTEGQIIIKKVGNQNPRDGTILKINGDRLEIKFHDAPDKISKIYPDSIEKK